MRFYVMADNNTVFFKTEEAAKLFAYTMLTDDNVKELEVGVEDPKDWGGMSTLYVLKSEGFNNELTIEV